MKTIKRISALLLAVILIASFSITAFAESVNNDDLDVNDGYIATNNASIGINNGTIGGDPEEEFSGNVGTVENNSSSGVIFINRANVGENNGIIVENYGEVTANKGTVVKNYGCGMIMDNSGTVGIVENGNYFVNMGTVENNSGTVYNIIYDDYTNPQVINNFGDGTVITVDYQNHDIAPSCAQHQFDYYAELAADDANNPTTTGDIKEYDGKYWLESDTNADGTVTEKAGSVTVTPKSGYTFDTPNVSNPKIVSVSGNNSGWTFSFSSLFENISISIKSIKDPEPVKPTPAPAVAMTYKLTFVLDGGTIDGKSEYSKTYSYGQHIKLPIPEKEGFTFGGWETTVRGKTVTYEGGARYTVTAAKTFTAIWLEG